MVFVFQFVLVNLMIVSEDWLARWQLGLSTSSDPHRGDYLYFSIVLCVLLD